MNLSIQALEIGIRVILIHSSAQVKRKVETITNKLQKQLANLFRQLLHSLKYSGQDTNSYQTTKE